MAALMPTMSKIISSSLQLMTLMANFFLKMVIKSPFSFLPYTCRCMCG